MTAKTTAAADTFTVLFPIFKGSKTFRQIGVTNNPAVNYRPGVTTQFESQTTGKRFVLTGGGLVEVGIIA